MLELEFSHILLEKIELFIAMGMVSRSFNILLLFLALIFDQKFPPS